MNNKLDRVLGLLGDGANNNEPEMDRNDYVKKTNIERAARSAARQYCPVPQIMTQVSTLEKLKLIQKSDVPMPDLKDYVLKSTIPPATKCPTLSPKVNVSVGFCKSAQILMKSVPSHHHVMLTSVRMLLNVHTSSSTGSRTT